MVTPGRSTLREQWAEDWRLLRHARWSISHDRVWKRPYRHVLHRVFCAAGEDCSW